ncbi:MAG: phospholipid carrier-dependent glycosyltransferase [Chloroflexi bacterium]|nr:phospholipid carrier-dependent glycosyltransferase [Chloroflexota bacterium]
MKLVQTRNTIEAVDEAPLGIRISPLHKGRFALGLLLVLVAQFLFLQHQFTIFNFGLMEWVRTTFFIDFQTPGNRIAAVIFFLVGAMLIWKSICTIQPAPPPVNNLPRQPVPLIGFLRRNLFIFITIALLMAYLLSQLSQIDTAIGPVIVWIFVMLLAVWVARAYDKESGVRLSLNIDRADILAMLVVFALGLAIGSYQLAQIPNTYNDDEPEFLNEMKFIVQGREERGFFAPGVFDFPLASNYWQSLSFSILGISVFSWRFSSVFSGMLALFPMYILARIMFDRRTAILAGILLITLPYFIAFNRLGYNNSQALFPTALALCFLYIGLQRRSMVYMALGGIAAGIGFYTYTAARIALVIAILFFAYRFLGTLYHLLRSPRSSPERAEASREAFRLLGMGIVYGGVAALVLIPQLVFASAILPNLSNPKVLDNFLPNAVYGRAFYPPEELFRDYPPIEYAGQTFFFRPDIYVILFLRGLILTVLAFHDGTVANLNFVVGPLTGLISAAFYGIGLVIAFKKLRDPRYVLLLLWIGSTMFFLSIISTEPPRQTHLVSIIPALPILTAVGLITVINFLSDRIDVRKFFYRFQVRRLGSAVVTVGLLAIIIAPNLKNYFVDVPAFYPPEIEQLIAWGALNASPTVPRTLIFANAYVDPRWLGLTPRVSELVGMPTKLVKVDVDDLIHGRYRFIPNHQYVIYCLSYDWPRIEKYAQTLPNSWQILPIFHAERDGVVTVVEFTFNAPPDMPLPDGYPPGK